MHFPVLQNMKIVAKYPLAIHFIFPKRPAHRAFRFLESSGRGRLVWVKTKVSSQLDRRLISAEIKKPGYQIDHIPGGPQPKQ